MPDTPTSRLSLYKSASDGSEDVDYTQDIGDNLDKIDLAVGALACTSSTRPSVPWNGQLIRETDTDRLWVSNGSSPASGSWSEICTPGTTQLFTDGIGSIGSATSTVTIASYVDGDAANRYAIHADGKQEWGSGSATLDTNLYRSAANTLKTDDSFVAGGTVTAQVETTTSGATAATNWSTATFAARRTCGIATVYVSMTYSGSTLTGSSSGNLTDTLAVTLPTGWAPASGTAYEAMFNKGNLACGAVSILSDGTCTLRTLDPTATIASGDSIDFSATYVL